MSPGSLSPDNIIPGEPSQPDREESSVTIPLPNQPGIVGVNGFNGTNNYFNNAVRADNFTGYLGPPRLERQRRHKFFWSFRQNDRVEDRSDRFGNDVNGNFLRA